MLLSNKNTLSTDINNMDGSQNLNGKNQTQKKNRLYNSIYIKCKLIYRQKADQWYTPGTEGGMSECKGQKELLGVMEISWLW